MPSTPWAQCLLSLACLAPLPAAVQSDTFRPGGAYSVPRWSVLDLAFAHNARDTADPFAIEFSAVFAGPAGATLRVPGFYDGDNTFRLRFCPPAEGVWRFQTASSRPALAGLAGTVTAAAPGAGAKGPITIPPANPRHFAYANGAPYFTLAFEADWLFALDAGNKTGIPKTRTLVDQIAANGFNQVVMNVYAYEISWPKVPAPEAAFDYGSPAVFPFGGTNDKPDFSTLNTAFFQHLDRVISYMDDKGIAAHLMIYVWNKKVSWPEARSAADNRYFDYVVKRYQAFPNLIWDISKEALGYGHSDVTYIKERIDRLRLLDAHGRLVTVHDFAFCSRFPEAVDFISIQNWNSDLHRRMTDIATRFPSKPAFNIEHGGYERGPVNVFVGDYDDPVTCLRRNYEVAFAGAYSTYYWQDTSWSVVMHDPMGLPEAQRPRFDYYRHFRRLFDEYDFSRLQPVPVPASSGYALSDGKSRYMILVPGENIGIHIRMNTWLGRKVRARWFHPLTGAFQDGGTLTMEAHQHFQSPVAAPFHVLILDAL